MNIDIRQIHILLFTNVSVGYEPIKNLINIISQHPSIALSSPNLQLTLTNSSVNHIQGSTIKDRNWNLSIVFGDNQLLMKAFSYFDGKNSPPIIAIGHGTSSTFYYYFHFQAEGILRHIIKYLLNENKYMDNLSNSIFQVQSLMKLIIKHNCQKLAEATSQIEIHRGMKTSILVLNIFLQTKEKLKIKICQFKGDGLLISTPMGSYGKSLNYNGPVMAYNMQNIMITPICPLSMRFRPICLPAEAVIFIQIDLSCRAQQANIYVDDNVKEGILFKGQSVKIKNSKFKSNLAYKSEQSQEQLFIKHLKKLINWGENNQHIEIEQILKKKTSLIQ